MLLLGRLVFVSRSPFLVGLVCLKTFLMGSRSVWDISSEMLISKDPRLPGCTHRPKAGG